MPDQEHNVVIRILAESVNVAREAAAARHELETISEADRKRVQAAVAGEKQVADAKTKTTKAAREATAATKEETKAAKEQAQAAGDQKSTKAARDAIAATKEHTQALKEQVKAAREAKQAIESLGKEAQAAQQRAVTSTTKTTRPALEPHTEVDERPSVRLSEAEIARLRALAAGPPPRPEPKQRTTTFRDAVQRLGPDVIAKIEQFGPRVAAQGGRRSGSEAMNEAVQVYLAGRANGLPPPKFGPAGTVPPPRPAAQPVRPAAPEAAPPTPKPAPAKAVPAQVEAERVASLHARLNDLKEQVSNSRLSGVRKREQLDSINTAETRLGYLSMEDVTDEEKPGHLWEAERHLNRVEQALPRTTRARKPPTPRRPPPAAVEPTPAPSKAVQDFFASFRTERAAAEAARRERGLPQPERDPRTWGYPSEQAIEERGLFSVGRRPKVPTQVQAPEELSGAVETWNEIARRRREERVGVVEAEHRAAQRNAQWAAEAAARPGQAPAVESKRQPRSEIDRLAARPKSDLHAMADGLGIDTTRLTRPALAARIVAARKAQEEATATPPESAPAPEPARPARKARSRPADEPPAPEPEAAAEPGPTAAQRLRAQTRVSLEDRHVYYQRTGRWTDANGNIIPKPERGRPGPAPEPADAAETPAASRVKRLPDAQHRALETLADNTPASINTPRPIVSKLGLRDSTVSALTRSGHVEDDYVTYGRIGRTATLTDKGHDYLAATRQDRQYAELNARIAEAERQAAQARREHDELVAETRKNDDWGRTSASRQLADQHARALDAEAYRVRKQRDQHLIAGKRPPEPVPVEPVAQPEATEPAKLSIQERRAHKERTGEWVNAFGQVMPDPEPARPRTPMSDAEKAKFEELVRQGKARNFGSKIPPRLEGQSPYDDLEPATPPTPRPRRKAAIEPVAEEVSARQDTAKVFRDFFAVAREERRAAEATRHDRELPDPVRDPYTFGVPPKGKGFTEYGAFPIDPAWKAPSPRRRAVEQDEPEVHHDQGNLLDLLDHQVVQSFSEGMRRRAIEARPQRPAIGGRPDLPAITAAPHDFGDLADSEDRVAQAAHAATHALHMQHQIVQDKVKSVGRLNDAEHDSTITSYALADSVNAVNDAKLRHRDAQEKLNEANRTGTAEERRRAAAAEKAAAADLKRAEERVHAENLHFQKLARNEAAEAKEEGRRQKAFSSEQSRADASEKRARDRFSAEEDRSKTRFSNEESRAKTSFDREEANARRIDEEKFRAEQNRTASERLINIGKIFQEEAKLHGERIKNARDEQAGRRAEQTFHESRARRAQDDEHAEHLFHEGRARRMADDLRAAEVHAVRMQSLRNGERASRRSSRSGRGDLLTDVGHAAYDIAEAGGRVGYIGYRGAREGVSAYRRLGREGIGGAERVSRAATAAGQAVKQGVSSSGPAFRDLWRDLYSSLEDAGTRLGSFGKQFARTMFSWRGVVILAIAALGPLVATLGGLGGAAIGAANAMASMAGSVLALPGLFAAAGVAVGALVVALQPLGGVFKAYQAHQQAVKAGSLEAADAQRKAAEQTRQALHSQQQATIGYSQALYTENRAQVALNQARRDATRQLEDLRTEVNRANLTEEGAIIALRQAQLDYRRTLADSNATTVDRASAAHRVKEAEADLVDVRTRNTRAAQDLAVAERKGVEGSDQVVAANNAAQNAAQGVAEAVYQLGEAHRQLIQAQKEQAAGGAQGLQTFNALRDELGKLGPNTRTVVEYLFGMAGAWRAVQRNVSERLFTPVLGQLDKFPGLLDTVNTLLGTAAGALGNVAAKGIAMMASGPWKADFGRIADNNAVLINNLGDAGLYVADAFRNITIAAQPFTTWVSEAIKTVAKHFADWAAAGRDSGSIAEFLDRTKHTLQQVGKIVSNLWGFFVSMQTASSGFTDWFLDRIIAVTDGWKKWGEAQEGTGSSFQRWLQDIKPLLSEVWDFLVSVGKAFGEMAADPRNIAEAKAILQALAKDVLPPLVGIFGKLAESHAMSRILEGVGRFLTAVEHFLDKGGTLPLETFLGFLIGIADHWVRIVSNPTGAAVLTNMAKALALFIGVAAVYKLTGLSRLVSIIRYLSGKQVVRDLFEKMFGRIPGVSWLADLLGKFRNWTKPGGGPGSTVPGTELEVKDKQYRGMSTSDALARIIALIEEKVRLEQEMNTILRGMATTLREILARLGGPAEPGVSGTGGGRPGGGGPGGATPGSPAGGGDRVRGTTFDPAAEEGLRVAATALDGSAAQLDLAARALMQAALVSAIPARALPAGAARLALPAGAVAAERALPAGAARLALPAGAEAAAARAPWWERLFGGIARAAGNAWRGFQEFLIDGARLAGRAWRGLLELPITAARLAGRAWRGFQEFLIDGARIAGRAWRGLLELPITAARGAGVAWRGFQEFLISGARIAGRAWRGLLELPITAARGAGVAWRGFQDFLISGARLAGVAWRGFLDLPFTAARAAGVAWRGFQEFLISGARLAGRAWRGFLDLPFAAARVAGRAWRGFQDLLIDAARITGRAWRGLLELPITFARVAGRAWRGLLELPISAARAAGVAWRGFQDFLISGARIAGRAWRGLLELPISAARIAGRAWRGFQDFLISGAGLAGRAWRGLLELPITVARAAGNAWRGFQDLLIDGARVAGAAWRAVQEIATVVARSAGAVVRGGTAVVREGASAGLSAAGRGIASVFSRVAGGAARAGGSVAERLLPALASGGRILPKILTAGGLFADPFMLPGLLTSMGADYGLFGGRGSTGKQAGQAAGATLTGASVGGTIGTMIMPGIGTAIGAGVGAGVGAGYSLYKDKGFRDKTANWLTDSTAGQLLTGPSGQIAGKLLKTDDKGKTGVEKAWDTAYEGFMNKVGSPVAKWFTTSLPNFFTKTIPNFFTKTIPDLWNRGTHRISEFFTKDIPRAFHNGVAGIQTFFTRTLPALPGKAAHALRTALVNAIGDFVGIIKYDIPFYWGKFTKFLSETVFSGKWWKHVWDDIIWPYTIGGLINGWNAFWGLLSDTIFSGKWWAHVWNDIIWPYTIGALIIGWNSFWSLMGETIFSVKWWEHVWNDIIWPYTIGALINGWNGFWALMGETLFSGKWWKHVWDDIIWPYTIGALINGFSAVKTFLTETLFSAKFWSDIGTSLMNNVLKPIGKWFSDTFGWLGDAWNSFWSDVGKKADTHKHPGQKTGTGHQSGGLVEGAYDGRVDTLPRWLTAGEWVTRKRVVDKPMAKALLADLNEERLDPATLYAALDIATQRGPRLINAPARAAASSTVINNDNTRNAGMNIDNLTINNPTREPSTRSMRRSLQTLAYIGQG